MKMHKFYEDTLITRYIKNLLESEYIPNLDIAEDGDILIKDVHYILDYVIIRCVQTGRLFLDKDKSGLFPSDKVYPSVINYPNFGEVPARYQIISYIDEKDKSYMKKFVSDCNYYDLKTHKYLGDFLRYFQLKNNVNIMPFYNCCNFQPIKNFSILSSISSGKFYEFRDNSAYRVILAPIKFNKRYTIALDCKSEVLMHAIIYNDKTGRMIQKNSNSYYTDDLSSSYKRFAKMDFTKPQLYSFEITSKNLYSMKNNLYLAIQVPYNNTSSVVVLEGDYTKSRFIEADEKNILIPKFKNNYSLLSANSNKSYAFSYRLIEYLSNNIIHKNTELTGNIAKIQNFIRSKNKTYDNMLKDGRCKLGYWDRYINIFMFDLLQDKNNTFLYDINDDVNKDIEQIFAGGGSY